MVAIGDFDRSLMRLQSQLPPPRMPILDDSQEQENKNDEEDEADAAAAVVADARTHAKAAKAEQQNQDDEQNDHCGLSPFGEVSPMEGVMQILTLLSSRRNIFCRLRGGAGRFYRSVAGSGASKPKVEGSEYTVGSAE